MHGRRYSLKHEKRVGDSLTVLCSSESIEQMDGMCRDRGTRFSLEAAVNANLPLLIDHTYNSSHRGGGFRQKQESDRLHFKDSLHFRRVESLGDVISEA